MQQKNYEKSYTQPLLGYETIYTDQTMQVMVPKNFTESCHTYEESTVNFSNFMEQYTRHEKCNKIELHGKKLIFTASSTEFQGLKPY